MSDVFFLSFFESLLAFHAYGFWHCSWYIARSLFFFDSFGILHIRFRLSFASMMTTVIAPVRAIVLPFVPHASQWISSTPKIDSSPSIDSLL